MTLSWKRRRVFGAVDLTVDGNVSYQDTTFNLDENLLTDREIELLTLNELYPSLMYKGIINLGFPDLLININARLSAYAERKQSQTNQSIERPLVGTPPRTIDFSYPLHLTVSTLGLRILPDRETILRFSVFDALNTQSVEPGFNGINIPALGRRLFFSVSQAI